MCSQTKDREINKGIALRTLENKLNNLVNNANSHENMKQTIYKRKDKKKMNQMERRQIKTDLKANI